MFLVLVIQRIEGKDSEFRITQISRFRFLFPELVGPTEVEQVVAADAGIDRWDAEWGKLGEGRVYRIGGCADYTTACTST